MASTSPDALVPTFNLYGESGELADILHLETISERSVRHDWTIRPHRHARLHQFLLFERGGGAVRIETREAPIAPGQMLSLPAGVVHGFAFEPGTAGWVLTLPAGTLDAALREGEGLRAAFGRPVLLSATDEIRAVFGQIAAEYAGRGFARAHLLRARVAVLAGLAARAAAAEGLAGPPPDPLLRRFEALVEREFRNHWPVARFAGALGVTPGHLSRRVRAATGKPASRILRERLMREARRELAYTTRPVASIAYDLGYADPAYFSRVFTEATGQSPSAFRAGLHGA